LTRSRNVYIDGEGIFDLNCVPANIVRVNAAGNTVFSYTGSKYGVGPIDLAVDPAGEFYLLFATLTGGGSVGKMSADRSRFLYSAILPTAPLTPVAIRLDAQGNAYLACATRIIILSSPLSADGSAFLLSVTLPGSGGHAR